MKEKISAVAISAFMLIYLISALRMTPVRAQNDGLSFKRDED